ncbi:MAG: type III-B CRISPR module RAMP protein Cmr6 [Chitinivibrionales bacterium]|nr:type III-B CRISPR module RAMP protein Cmr6 [Chitinivibrionales bacterium]
MSETTILLPIPEKQERLLRSGKNGNFSLIFPRLVHWVEVDSQLKAKYQSGKNDRNEEPIYDSSIVEIKDIGSRVLPGAAIALKNVHARQEQLLKSRYSPQTPVFEFKATLASPFISGLGSGHPTETGMILDRNTGLPYIPASGIKGVLRLAHALEIARENPAVVKQNKKGEWEVCNEISSIIKYFGSTETKNAVRGQLVFLDTFPAEIPTLKVDIMNPHYGKYYRGEQPPLETESPVPIKFIVIQPNTQFIFRCFVSPLARPEKKDGVDRDWTSEDARAVEGMFMRAFEVLGFGAKTAIGYGRFRKDEFWNGVERKLYKTEHLCQDPPLLQQQNIKQRSTAFSHKKNRNHAKTTQQQESINRSASGLKAGDKVTGILLEEKTKKGGWRIQCKEDPSLIGPITDSNLVPADKKPEDEIALVVTSIKGNRSQFKVA